MKHNKGFLLAATLLTGVASSLSAATVTWTGATNGTWDTTTLNWAGPSAYNNTTPDAVVFDDTGANTSITLAAAMSPLSVTVNNSTKNYTFAGSAINGAGSLLKQGTGTLTLAAGNGYTGGTTVSTGTLRLGNAASAGTGLITLNDANTGSNNTTLNLDSGNVTYANAITVAAHGAGTTTIAYTAASNGATSGTGMITLNGAATFTAANLTGYMSWTGTLAGSGTLTIGSTNGQRLIIGASGGAANYTGDVTVSNNAILEIRDAFSNSSGNNFTVNGGGILQITYKDGVINALNGDTGSVVRANLLGTNNASPGPINLTVGKGNGSGAFAGTLQQAGGDTLYFIKAGTGTQTLSGANTYTGTTTVNGGTLLINGVQSAATGAITVAATATLGGAGTTGASLVTVNGNITGGTVSTTGTLTANAVTLTATGHYVAQIDSSAITADKLAVSGALTLTAGSVLDLTDLGAGTVGAGTKLLIASYGSRTGVFNNYTDGQIFTLGANQWQFSYNDGNAISITAVPEPGTYGLLGAGALAGFAFVRRRRRLA